MKEQLIKLGFLEWLSELDVAPYPVIFWDIPKFIQFSYIQKWLKQTYKLFISVTPCSDGEFIFTIYDLNKCEVGDVYVEDLIIIESDSYEEDEEALEAGLQEALKLIKQ